MGKKTIWVFLCLILVLNSGCGMSPEEAAIVTNEAQTATASSWTATPTATPTSTPTLTPTATATPTPLPTPLGESSGQIVFWIQATNNTGNANLDSSFYSIGLYNMQSEQLSIIEESDGRSVLYTSSSVSSDGKFIYLIKEEENPTSRGLWWNEILYEYSLETGEMRRLSAAPQFSGSDQADYLLREYWPDISHDGSMLVFNSNRDYLSYTNPPTNLYIMDLTTFEISRIPSTANQAFRARFSPDGTQIAYTAWDGDWEIYTQNIDGTNLQKITNNTASDRFPEWSPDGTQLVFHSDRDGNIELYTYNFSTTEVTRLTYNPAIDATASWSPDGTMIIYGSDQDGDTDIYCINIETLEVTKILNTDNTLAVVIWVP